MHQPIISVQGLRRHFRVYQKAEGFFASLKSVITREWRSVEAVKGINFSIEKGEFVGFLGPNGAGKTTTLKMLSGILSPTQGECSVLGYIPFKRDKDFRRKISLVMGQKTQLIWDLPPMDTFALHKDLYRIPYNEWRSRLDALISLLNVGHVLQTPTRQLSLGERMKCEIIASLIHAPDVLFLDEPTIGLDVISQRALWSFLREYQRKEGTTILLTSHNMQDIANLCSRVIVINMGRLVYDGTLTQLIELTQPVKEVTVQLSHAISQSDEWILSTIADGVHWNISEDLILRAYIPRESFSNVVRKMLEYLPVEDIMVKEVDFSSVMKESFLLSPEEVPLRMLTYDFRKKFGDLTKD